MKYKTLAGPRWCVLIFVAVVLSGCATRPAPDFGGRWKAVNHYSASAEAIPLYKSYVFHASPMDGTLKNMLTRWASDSKMVWKNMRSLERAEFGSDILHATQTGNLTRCGKDALCVKVGKDPKRAGANGEYLIVED